MPHARRWGTLLLVLLVPSASAQAWEVLVEDRSGVLAGDAPAPGVDLTTVRADVASADVLRFAIGTRETPHPGQGAGFAIYYVYFEVQAIYERADGTFALGAPMPFRAGAYLWGDPQGGEPIADFDLRAGEESRTWYAQRGNATEGAVDLAGKSIEWRLDRTRLSELGNGTLPLDRAWLVTHVFAEARVTSEWFSEALLLTGLRPVYQQADSPRTDRAPDWGFGNTTQTAPLLPKAVADPPLPHSASLLGSEPLLWVSIVGIILSPIVWLARRSVSAWFVAIPLFSRIHRDDALDHARRALILEVVTNQPGVGFVDLRRATGFGSGTLAHHLAVLRQHKLIDTRKRGRRSVYFRQGTTLHDPVQPVDEVLRYLQQAPASNATAIAKALQRPRTTIAYQLQQLERLGVLTSQKAGRDRRYQVLPQS